MKAKSFLTNEEIDALGFAKVGRNVLISKYARFYFPRTIEIGDNVRIDDFCIISGKVVFEGYNHIAAYAAIFAGQNLVKFDKFSGLSSYAVVYAAVDDFSGDNLVGPVVPNEFRNLISSNIIIKSHCHIGPHSVVLPNTIFSEGACLGPMTLVYNMALKEWTYYLGNPARPVLKKENKNLLICAEHLLKR